MGLIGEHFQSQRRGIYSVKIQKAHSTIGRLAGSRVSEFIFAQNLCEMMTLSDRAVVFDEPQQQGIKSKIWATGPRMQVTSLTANTNKIKRAKIQFKSVIQFEDDSQQQKKDGSVFGIAFPQLKIGNETIDQSNAAQFFALGSQCSPQSSLGGNVANITFGRMTNTPN